MTASYSGVAHAADKQTMTYDVYGGGLRLISAVFDIQQSGSDYRVDVNAKTTGLARFLTPWKGLLRSEGQIKNGETLPLRHESVSTWPDNQQIKRYTYDNAGNLRDISIVDQGRDQTPREAVALAEGGIDMLSATLEIMRQTAATGQCEGSSTVFDGKRRFQLEAIPAGTEQLEANRYNNYSGPAQKCEIRVVPQGGDWHEKLQGWMLLSETGQKERPVVWLAQMEEGRPAVPVKMRAKSKYGAFLIHMKSYQGYGG